MLPPCCAIPARCRWWVGYPRTQGKATLPRGAGCTVHHSLPPRSSPLADVKLSGGLTYRLSAPSHRLKMSISGQFWSSLNGNASSGKVELGSGPAEAGAPYGSFLKRRGAAWANDVHSLVIAAELRRSGSRPRGADRQYAKRADPEQLPILPLAHRGPGQRPQGRTIPSPATTMLLGSHHSRRLRSPLRCADPGCCSRCAVVRQGSWPY